MAAWDSMRETGEEDMENRKQNIGFAEDYGFVGNLAFARATKWIGEKKKEKLNVPHEF